MGSTRPRPVRATASGPAGDGDRSVAADLAALRAGGDGAPAERTIVDVDTWSFITLAVAALGAAAVFAVVSVAADVLTGIGVGVVVGVALAPVVSAVQRRADMTRGSAVVLVGTGLALAIAAVVLLVAPAAVRQAQDFSDELPETVEDFYSWPIVGDRLAGGRRRRQGGRVDPGRPGPGRRRHPQPDGESGCWAGWSARWWCWSPPSA